MIQTARAMVEENQGMGQGVVLKRRGGQQAQVSRRALPQLTPSLRGILDSSNLLSLVFSLGLIHSRVPLLTCFLLLLSSSGKHSFSPLGCRLRADA